MLSWRGRSNLGINADDVRDLLRSGLGSTPTGFVANPCQRGNEIVISNGAETS